MKNEKRKRGRPPKIFTAETTGMTYEGTINYALDRQLKSELDKALADKPDSELARLVIETPVGDYSPDWAIVYQKPNDTVALYFIAETKWDKDAGDLNEDEHIKIKCAKKHFTAVNDSTGETVKYAWVNGYMDGSKSQSFPQVFIDDHYTDSMTLFESNN